jgi:hypothetical protein
MQNLVKIYNDNSELIEKFIISTLRRLHIEEVSKNSFDRMYDTFSSLELDKLNLHLFLKLSKLCWLTSKVARE